MRSKTDARKRRCAPLLAPFNANVRHLMPIYRCPSCGKDSFSFWQKQSLGPLRKITCRSCGARVSVPWGMSTLIILIGVVATPTVALVAAVTAWNAFGAFGGIVTFLGSGLALGAIGCWLYHRFVPLVTRDA